MEFPVRFENPLLSILGIILAGTFTLLFYLSYKRIRIAEKKLELVKWQKVRKIINVTNICTKMGTIIALSFLLAVPYFPTTIAMPVENISSEQLAKSSVTILMLMDVSQSMNISDLSPSRLAVAKQVASLFVDSAGLGDQIGFISFAGKIYDETLPTTNRTIIKGLIERQTIHNSTAIGTALEAALGTLQNVHGGKTIVLLSDGKNNYGVTNLTSTAQSAASLKIPIFTVFLGTYGVGTSDPLPLQEISNVTGGKFHEIRSEEITTLATEIARMAQEVKVEALKTIMNEVPIDARDYHTAVLVFATLLVCCLFLTWFTGV
ncbi:MAG TPA: VWA domain-containing protein [Candidatus Bathyarchaeia archaeon]|nr:VWA domain-containing protein [Candidatus Bathyarchaeia archaeon]